MSLRHTLVLLFASSLAACGFHLRGHDSQQLEFPVQRLYLKATQESQFIADLRHHLQRNHLELMADPTAAELILEIEAERSDKQILSLSAAGRVREYTLHYAVTLRAYDTEQRPWLDSSEIHVQRVMTYDDTLVLAKEQEEALLYRDMRQDAVQQLLRHLSHARPQKGQP